METRLSGSAFQILVAATGKARLPTVGVGLDQILISAGCWVQWLHGRLVDVVVSGWVSGVTSSDWQWLYNYGTLLRATDALARRSCLSPTVFSAHDKEHCIRHSARHPLVWTPLNHAFCITRAEDNWVVFGLFKFGLINQQTIDCW